MSRNKKFTLTTEEILDPIDEMLESTSVLMWNTSYADYTFAFYLNQLYDMNLERRDQIFLSVSGKEVECSVFSQIDCENHLTYFLVESTQASRQKIRQLSYFDKFLLIQGDFAHERMEQIYNDSNKTPQEVIDIVSMQRESLRQTFITSGIIQSACMEFSDEELPSTTITSNPTKSQRDFLLFQKEFIQSLLVQLDDLIGEYE